MFKKNNFLPEAAILWRHNQMITLFTLFFKELHFFRAAAAKA
jgi:hypothetical protein